MFLFFIYTGYKPRADHAKKWEHKTQLQLSTLYKVVQIWPGRFVCKQVTVCPGHIWTTLYLAVPQQGRRACGTPGFRETQFVYHSTTDRSLCTMKQTRLRAVAPFPAGTTHSRIKASRPAMEPFLLPIQSEEQAPSLAARRQGHESYHLPGSEWVKQHLPSLTRLSHPAQAQL